MAETTIPTKTKQLYYVLGSFFVSPIKNKSLYQAILLPQKKASELRILDSRINNAIEQLRKEFPKLVESSQPPHLLTGESLGNMLEREKYIGRMKELGLDKNIDQRRKILKGFEYSSRYYFFDEPNRWTTGNAIKESAVDAKSVVTRKESDRITMVLFQVTEAHREVPLTPSKVTKKKMPY